MSMLAGAAMIFGIKCGAWAKFWTQKVGPNFAIKTAMDSCSLIVYISSISIYIQGISSQDEVPHPDTSWRRNSWHQCWRNELIDRELGSKQQIPRGHQIGWWCFFPIWWWSRKCVLSPGWYERLANNWGNNVCPLGHRCFSLHRDWIDSG